MVGGGTIMKFIIEISLNKKQAEKLKKSLNLLEKLQLKTKRRMILIPDFLLRRDTKLLGTKIKPEDIFTYTN